jgi:GNAT superfamily N-acetyltransferase
MLPNLRDIQIRPLSFAQENFAQVAAWHHQECVRQGLKSTLELRTQRLRRHLHADPVPQTLVALSGEQALGCVSLVNYNVRADNSVFIPRSTSLVLAPLWLSNLFVCEPLRRRGLGSLLVTAAEDYARGLAADFTEFYQKRGWEITRRTRLGGRIVNIMKRSLV